MSSKATGDERAFHRAMIGIYESAKRDLSYNATRFLQMVSEHGGVEAARQLLRAQGVSDGFTVLWERKRLDLSVEYHVLLPRFRRLFSAEERAVARRRLEEYGFDVSRIGR